MIWVLGGRYSWVVLGMTSGSLSDVQPMSGVDVESQRVSLNTACTVTTYPFSLVNKGRRECKKMGTYGVSGGNKESDKLVTYVLNICEHVSQTDEPRGVKKKATDHLFNRRGNLKILRLAR